MAQEGGEHMDTQPLDQARTTGCLSGPTARLQRRQLLQAAVAVAGAGLVGCGRRSAAPSRASAAAPITLGVAPFLPPPAYQQALQARFSAENPGFRIVYTGAKAPAAKGIRWWLVDSFTLSGPQATDTVDLLPALKSLNFNESVIDAALWNAFVRGGRMTALPTQLSPMCIQYWPDVFAAAQVPLPLPDWTWGDFLLTCERLQGAIKAGHLNRSGVGSVLPRMTGSEEFFRQHGLVQLNNDDLWMAFIMGYGGSVVTDGVATLNSPAAADAVTQFVEMVGQYASSAHAPPPKNNFAVPEGVAMGFQSYPRHGGLPSKSPGARRFARFPRLPKRSVVPADLGGRALHNNPDALSELPSNLEVPADILEAAGRYFIWLYQPAQQELLGKAGIPPVIADDSIQKAFWSQYNIDLTASDMVFPLDTWGRAISQLDWRWLATAVSDPKEVPDLLNQAADTINATIAREKASGGSAAPGSASGAAAQRQAQASAARAFPAKGSKVATGGG
jgi:ABC-type glycerol-3-phosphate transport system substrate-binding protein